MKLFILVALFGLSLAQHNPHTKHGRTAIVHLFEWRWADIAAECERFLAPNGYGGVQVRMAEHRDQINIIYCRRFLLSLLERLLFIALNLNYF